MHQFLSQVARLDKVAFAAVIQAGFLEMLLWTCRRVHSVARRCDAFEHALLSLSESKGDSRKHWDNRLGRLWPSGLPVPSLYQLLRFLDGSPQLWLVVEAQFLKHQAHSMLQIVQAFPVILHYDINGTFPSINSAFSNLGIKHQGNACATSIPLFGNVYE